MVETTKYIDLKDRYLKEAKELIANGNYLQAGEKLWGASAEIVKAVAAKGGKMLTTHKSIADYVVELDKEHPEWNLIDAFSIAQGLHVNFYEDELPKRYVERGYEIVKEFVDKLESLW